MAPMASVAAMGWWCRVVQELRWHKSWASKETGKPLGTSLRTTTAPRVSDGSKSLRRVDQLLELVLKDPFLSPTKLLENELKDCPTKLLENKLQVESEKRGEERVEGM